jgi:hypothetical protein
MEMYHLFTAIKIADHSIMGGEEQDPTTPIDASSPLDGVSVILIVESEGNLAQIHFFDSSFSCFGIKIFWY